MIEKGSTFIKLFKQFVWITLLLISTVAVSPVLASLSNSYNVLDFGAEGTGKILDTRAIQAAVDECSKNGGGTVLFPAGTYLSGTIYLKDYVNLNINMGAVLLGSDDVNDFPLNKCGYPSYSDNYVGRALIWGEGLKNISISGSGTIDGQGASFKDNIPNEYELEKLVTFFDDKTRYSPEARYINRPYIIRLISCRNIRVEGITMRNSPMWMQQYLNCDFLSVNNITVYNHGSYNNDMIDVDCCRNVVIRDCFGDSADDALTLKSTGASPTENVTITNCVLSSFCNAIKMGTESSGGFKNISITNCVIRSSSEPVVLYGRKEGLAGIALEIVDGGLLDGVTISNIAIAGTTAPIFLRLGNRGRQYQPTVAEPQVGALRNVVISNIVASQAQLTGCSITGIPGYPIENVTLSNIKINFVGGGTKLQAQANVLEHVDKYPESTMFGILPASGFFCRHVDGLTFRDIDIDYNTPEYRPALICDDVSNLKLFNFNARVSENAIAQMTLRNSHEVFISECQPPKTNVFLRLEDNSNQIKIIGNNLSRVNRVFALDESMQMDAISIANNFSGKLALFEMLEPLTIRDDFGKVTIKSFTTDSEIRYTLNGSEVTRKSKKYTSPFTQIEECILKAKVFKNDLVSSSAELKLNTLPVLQPEIYPTNSYFYKDVDVTLKCKTPNAEIRYSTERSIPNEKWLVYKEPIKIKKSTSLYVQAFKVAHEPSEEIISKYELINKTEGIQYRYYLGEWNYLPDFFELTPEKKGVITQFDLDEIETPKMYYALVMIGFIDIQQPGNYTFYCGSNDGSKLYVDHNLLIENDGTHRFNELSGDIYLSKGLHQIDVQYFQKSELESLKVSWKGQHFEKRELSAEFLK